MKVKGVSLSLLYDKDDRLVTKPYSVENMHDAAKELSVKKCWFEKEHYKIPPFRAEEIKKHAKKVSTKTIDVLIKLGKQ